jgi:hypothetical protein
MITPASVRYQETLGHETDACLGSAFQRIAARVRPGRRILTVVRRPAITASSWSLEAIRLVLDEDEPIDLVLKDLDRGLGGDGSATSKPPGIVHPAREGWVYRRLVGSTRFSVPRCDFPDRDGTRGHNRLLMEAIEGRRLAERRFGPAWEAAARWIARFHAGARPPQVGRGPLIHHTPALHRWWFRRAIAIHPLRSELAALRRAHQRAIALATRSPWVPLHGEYYPANVLVEEGTGRIRPVDWEMAGIGSGLTDLAALSTGHPLSERECLEEAYQGEARRAGHPVPRGRAFHRELTAARLLLAVQWLGWARGWEPPPEHRFDWLAEALECATELRR